MFWNFNVWFLGENENRDHNYSILLLGGWGGGGLLYIKGGDARREISNEPLKDTNLGVALSRILPFLKGTNQKHRDKQISFNEFKSNKDN